MKKLILFIGLLLFAFLNVCAQKEYQIEQVSAINMGDGRILFRDLKTDKPLDGEHRIIDLSLIHISEPTRQAEISYAVFCLKKKNIHNKNDRSDGTKKRRRG